MDQSPIDHKSCFLALIQGTTAVPRAIAKLIATIGDQIGLYLEPIHIRRKAQAEADVRLSEAKVKAEIAVLKVENKSAIQDIQDRATERVRRREEKRQANLEAIASQATSEMPKTVSDVPVDEDWVAQFLNHCQDVSNEQMQLIWAKLLAGEVAKPGSFSLRTLGIVRVMSKDDANLFTRFCSMVWQAPDGLLPIILNLNNYSSFPVLTVERTDFLRLDSLGLIRFEAIANFSRTFEGEPRLPLHYHGRLHFFSKQDARDITIGHAILTDVGQELAAIAGSSAAEHYRSWVVTYFRNKGWEVLEAEPDGELPRGNG